MRGRELRPRVLTLVCMCGIVGYVGHQQALDVVMDGLRRLEYRGYDSAGVAVRRPRRVPERRTARRASWSTWRRSWPSTAAPQLPGHAASATPAGPRTAPRTTATPTPTSTSPAGSRVVHNGIIENFERAPRRARARRHRDVQRDRHRGRRPAARPRALGRGAAATLADAMRTVCRRLEGAFTLVAVDADAARARSSPPAATRRWSSGSATGENFLASDVSAFIAHTRARDGDRARTRSSRCTAEGVDPHDVDGDRSSSGKTFHVDWDADAAEKGGHPFFMLKEIDEQPQAVADTLARPASPRPALIAMDELRMSDDEVRGIDKIFIVACGTSYHAGDDRQVRHRALGAHPVRGRHGLGVPLPRPGARPRHPGHRDQPERRDRRHPARRRARPGPAGLGPGDHQHASARRWPATSDAVLYTRAGPEVGVASTKTFLATITATYLVGALARRAPRRAAARRGARRIVRAAAGDPGRHPAAARPAWSRCASWPASSPPTRSPRCCSSAGTSATRSRSRARSS